MDLNQLLPIFLLIVALIVVWGVLHFIMKLTAKVFACGCSLIVVAGGLLILLRFLLKS